MENANLPARREWEQGKHEKREWGESKFLSFIKNKIIFAEVFCFGK